MRLGDYLPEVPSLVQQEQKLASLTNQLSIMKAAGETYSPSPIGLDQLVSTFLRQQIAYRQQMVVDLMTIAMTVEEIRAPIHHVVSEVFRRGIQWKPKFIVKCSKCETEFQDHISECSVCKEQTELIKPDEKQKESLAKVLDDCNIWDNSLEEVLRQFHFDINCIDDAYLYFAKEYIEDPKGKIRAKTLEIRRLHPALIEFDLDQQGLPKNSHFICYIHREKTPSSTSGICEDCGRKLVPAMYKYWHRGKIIYLLDEEIIHLSKFQPSDTYGWSPILTVWEKALTIIGMDRNLYRYFYERKMPASMVMVFTDDPESLRRERAELAAKVRQDPNYTPMIAVSAKNNRGRVDTVKLSHTLQEMEYIPVRQEIRERIAAMWGVTPAWQGAPEAFGGLSSQTQQLTVMSRVVEGDQRMYHDKVFPRILEAFGITDWDLELPQPEEKAEATRIAFAQQKISAANMLLQMGFDIKIKSTDTGIEDIGFTISGEAKKPQPFGGFGGMGGGYGNEDQSSFSSEDEGLQQMQKAETWVTQIMNKGYPIYEIKKVDPDGPQILFSSSNQRLYKASFLDGKLLGVEKAVFPKLHSHGNYPLHDLTIPHEETKRDTVEKRIFEADEPETL